MNLIGSRIAISALPAAILVLTVASGRRPRAHCNWIVRPPATRALRLGRDDPGLQLALHQL
jgi:hypothetical protein